MSKASSRAYHAIRDAIVSGRFRPGERLTEEELAATCGVSRTPVRDALRLLAAESFVTSIPNHGTFVTKWSADDIRDIFELRAMLEGFGARRAATRATPAQLAAMEAATAAIEAELERPGGPDRDTFLISNRRFHNLILEAAGSEHLTTMVQRLVQPPVLARTAARYRAADLGRSNAHHREILEAFRAGDGQWAESVMIAHIHAGYRAYRTAQLGTNEPADAG